MSRPDPFNTPPNSLCDQFLNSSLTLLVLSQLYAGNSTTHLHPNWTVSEQKKSNPLVLYFIFFTNALTTLHNACSISLGVLSLRRTLKSDVWTSTTSVRPFFLLTLWTSTVCLTAFNADTDFAAFRTSDR